MTESLYEIKKTIAEAHEQGIYNWNTATISSLITTIESLQEKEQAFMRSLSAEAIKNSNLEKQIQSQKEEIEKYKANVMGIPLIAELHRDNIALRKQTESLQKMITNQLLFVQSLHQLTEDPITKEQCRLAIISLQEGDK